jgi:hypothetical protein
MQEGLANVCLMTAHMTVVRCKVEKTIPRKRPGYSGEENNNLSINYYCYYPARSMDKLFLLIFLRLTHHSLTTRRPYEGTSELL